MIDLSFLSEVVSDLDFFFTNLARSEQMKDIYIDKQTSKTKDEADQDVASTVVHVSYVDDSISLSLSTNENNKSYVWKENFYIMAKTLLADKIHELMSSCKSFIIDQIKPEIISMLSGGVFT